MKRNYSPLLPLCAPLLIWIAIATSVLGGDKFGTGKRTDKSFGPGSAILGDPYRFEGSYEVEEGGQRGRISVTAMLDGNFHIYSTTEPTGGPPSTVLTLSTKNVVLAGPFTPDSSPKIVLGTAGFESIPVEHHTEQVTWTAPVTFTVPATGAPGPIVVKIHSQVCADGDGGSCIPVRDVPVESKFAGFYAAAKAKEDDGPFREPSSQVQWTISASKQEVAPGGKLELNLVAQPDRDFHVYKFDLADPTVVNRTLIALTQKGGFRCDKPTTSSKLIKRNSGTDLLEYYDAEVQWTIPIQVPETAKEGIYPLEGLIGYQACTDKSCDQPRGLKFQLEINVARSAKGGEPISAAINAIPFQKVVDHPNRTNWVDRPKISLTLSPLEILSKFCLAMLGGLILNVMPCVLPVIGLKILGFVNEAGGNRKHASLLTLVYASGIIALILALGGLTVGVRMATDQAFGWGQQYSSITFRILITVFMFALSLSFLGVWEIPIPGFATSKAGTELASKEGFFGAFLKGIITTLLATPCSAPFLGSVFAVALTQPGWLVLLIFFAVGLGMALPYLLIAVWPQLLSFLPKPGPWMQTFKEFLAFPMLLSVVFFVSAFSNRDRMAMLCSLMFVWFACWFIGRVPAWAERIQLARAWAVASVVTIAGVTGSFYWLQPSQYQLPWQPYNERLLKALVADGNTVMVDFTANWCSNCQTNLVFAIHTKKVKDWVEANNVIPMVADWTDESPEIKAKLQELESNSIPVLAIYAPGNSDKPIILRDTIRESQLLEALANAGPSKNHLSRPTSTDNAQQRDVR